MKKLLILTSALLLTGSVFADNDPLWMRYPAISPDGGTIAFTYKGDIYTVPATGGKATQLTTHQAHDALSGRPTESGSLSLPTVTVTSTSSL